MVKMSQPARRTIRSTLRKLQSVELLPMVIDTIAERKHSGKPGEWRAGQEPRVRQDRSDGQGSTIRLPLRNTLNGQTFAQTRLVSAIRKKD